MRDKTHSQVPELPQSPDKPVVPCNTCFWVGKTISLLTFPWSERVGSILEAVCAPVLNHRSRDIQERPYDQGIRIANTAERRKGIMGVRVKGGSQASDGSVTVVKSLAAYTVQ